ncbi:hypothetical protein ACFHW2_11925 [Actinomadura sp. LOL_016]|uniref:hypothetical protein n=1 Tax=unclassified Actinomadura TaxID=2626254 RepID=UPI003A80493F
MYDHEEHQHEVAELIKRSYFLLVKVLGSLPLPIALPAHIAEGEWTGQDAANGLIRSADLVRDVPGISEEIQILIIQMIMDWLAAHTFGTLDYVQPAVWRLDIAEYAIVRLEAQAEIVADGLGIPRPDGDIE